MRFAQWLVESTIKVTQDMFLFAQEVLEKVKGAYESKKPLPMFKVFHSRDVSFGKYGRRFVQVRAAPIQDPRTAAKADGSLVTVFMMPRSSFCYADKNTLAHELIHVIDPGLNIKAGKRRADNSLASLNTRLQDIAKLPQEPEPEPTLWQRLFGHFPPEREDPMSKIIGGYANQDHEFNAYTGADAYSFVDDLYKTADDGEARDAVQKRLAAIKKAKHGDIDSVGTHYRDDRKRWKKFARAHYDAYDDYYGKPKQVPEF